MKEDIKTERQMTSSCKPGKRPELKVGALTEIDKVSGREEVHASSAPVNKGITVKQ